jgi:hypothetical protein
MLSFEKKRESTKKPRITHRNLFLARACAENKSVDRRFFLKPYNGEKNLEFGAKPQLFNNGELSLSLHWVGTPQPL